MKTEKEYKDKNKNLESFQKKIEKRKKNWTRIKRRNTLN